MPIALKSVDDESDVKCDTWNDAESLIDYSGCVSELENWYPCPTEVGIDTPNRDVLHFQSFSVLQTLLRRE